MATYTSSCLQSTAQHAQTHAHALTCTCVRTPTLFSFSFLQLSTLFYPTTDISDDFFSLHTPTVYKLLAKYTSAMHGELVGIDRGMGFVSSLIPPFTLPLSSLILQLQNYPHLILSLPMGMRLISFQS